MEEAKFVKPEELIDVLLDLKKNQEFQMLTDILGVDYPEQKERIEVVYILLSLTKNVRHIIKVLAKPGSSVPSACRVYKSACWLEREVYDMYGVIFENNSDMRRILTDYNFEHHPLLKDFPLTGYEEVRYDVETNKVEYSPVNLTQEYRNFDTLTPWEGTKYEKEKKPK